MVREAVKWMQMGLPLQCFKIVLYSKTPNKLSEKEKSCVGVFKEIRAQVQQKNTIPKVSLILMFQMLEGGGLKIHYVMYKYVG